MAQFEGGFSPETLASIPRRSIRSVDDLYPDRTATPSGTDSRGNNIYPKKETGNVMRLEGVPTTTKDMSNLFTWEIGDEIEGSFAKKANGMNVYISDILKAQGSQDGYKHIFIDTFKPVGPQLEKYKSRRKRRISIED